MLKHLDGFNQEKAQVGAFSVITNLCMDLRFKLYCPPLLVLQPMARLVPASLVSGQCGDCVLVTWRPDTLLNTQQKAVQDIVNN